MIAMPGRSHTGPLDPLTPAEQGLADELRRDVEALAGRIGERHTGRPAALREAADHVARSFADAGFEPRRQAFRAGSVDCENIEALIPGAAVPERSIVIGAHYDSAQGCPAANDNASGVAALLTLARALRNSKPRLSLRFVAFANEEPPYFRTPLMGSRIYAKECRSRDLKIEGMLSLETIGFYSDAPESQDYPFPTGLFYPDRGDFIGFVGNTLSLRLVRRTVGSFRRHTRFPSQGAAVPAIVRGAALSDHSSFWLAGYPALMVTDTAPYRYPYYHTSDDTPDKLDYDRMARVVAGLERVVRELASCSSPEADQR